MKKLLAGLVFALASVCGLRAQTFTNVTLNGTLTINASQISGSAIFPPAMLGIGTPSSATVLFGDGVWRASTQTIPSQTGLAGYFLSTNGTNLVWQASTLPAVAPYTYFGNATGSSASPVANSVLVLGNAPGFTDTAGTVAAQFTGAINNYYQIALQNTQTGTTASADFIVGTDNTTSTTFYGDFGRNSTTFSGSGSFNLPNAVYVYSAGGPLVLGTTTSDYIRFVTNNGTTDNVDIYPAGGMGIVGGPLGVRVGAFNNWDVTIGGTISASSATAAGTFMDATLLASASGDFLLGHWVVPAAVNTGVGLTGLTYKGIELGTAPVTGSSGLANSYQIYLEQGASATNQYGIFQAGTDPNVFSGSMQAASIQSTPIGSATPSTGAFTSLSASGSATFGGGVTGNYYVATSAQPGVNAANKAVLDEFSGGERLFSYGPNATTIGTLTANGLHSDGTGSTNIFTTDTSGNITFYQGIIGNGTLSIAGATTLTGNVTFGGYVTNGSLNISNSAVNATNSGVQLNNPSSVGPTIFSQAAVNANRWVDFMGSSATVASFVNATGNFNIATGASYNVALQLTSGQAVLATSPTGGIGYGTGAGGTVTQATSKAMAIALNKVTGAITLNGAALAANTVVSFSWTNTAITANNTIVFNIISGAASAGSYFIWPSEVVNGSCNVNIWNRTAGSLSEALVVQFNVWRGATS